MYQSNKISWREIKSVDRLKVSWYNNHVSRTKGDRQMKLAIMGDSELCIASLKNDIDGIVKGARTLNNITNLIQLRELGEIPENLDLTEVTPEVDIDTAVDQFHLIDDNTGRILCYLEVVTGEIAYENDKDFFGYNFSKEEYEANGGLGSEFSYYRKFNDSDNMYFRLL